MIHPNPLEFLANRLTYLRNLPAIGSGWLSQGTGTIGCAPEAHVCELAAQLLEALHVRGVLFTAQNLIMGPLTAGGVSLEVKLPGVSLLQLELANDGTAEYTYLAGSHRVEGYETALAAVTKFVDLLLPHAPLAPDARKAPKARAPHEAVYEATHGEEPWAWVWEHFNTATEKVVKTGIATTQVQPTRHAYYADEAGTQWIGTRVRELTYPA